MKQAFRKHLKQSFSNEELKRWYDPLEMTFSNEDSQLVIQFPHAFFASWFENSIQSTFESQLNLYLGNGYAISYQTSNTQKNIPLGGTLSSAVKRIDFPFDRQFTFDSFLINKKNYFPLASAREVAKQTGSLFNPFIICGPNGSGKTHLMKAVANEVSKHHDASKIFLGSMDQLHNLYAVEFRGDTFRARHYLFDFDFLFIDDFQQIRQYPSLQHEVVNIFNHFYDNKKQLIFTCRDKISGYDFLDADLQSRLGWGLIVTLKEPDLEIRVGYIQQQCRLKKLPLTKEQVLTLAQRFSDFRYLQGVLIKLFAYRELVRKDISQKDFEHILNNTEEKNSDDLTPKRIMQVVCEQFNVNYKELVGTKRHQHIAQARQVAMFLCREMLSVSYPALGRIFGGKDHSTVLYSVKKVEKLRDDDSDLKQVLKTLKKKCRMSGS